MAAASSIGGGRSRFVAADGAAAVAVAAVALAALLVLSVVGLVSPGTALAAGLPDALAADFALEADLVRGHPARVWAVERDGRIAVGVEGNAPFRASVRREISPPRFILDIDGLEAGLWAGALPVQGKAMREVTVTEVGPGKMRVTLGLSYLLDNWELIPSADGLSARLEVSLKYRREYSVAVEPGLTFTEIRLGAEAGPLLAEVLTLDPSRGRHAVRAVPVEQLGRLTSLVARQGALAAINGSYFSSGGQPLGLIISEGRLISGPVFERTALAVTGDGRPLIGPFGFRGEARVERWGRAAAEAVPSVAEVFAITAVNRSRGANELIAYTPDYGATTRTNRYGLEVAVVDGVVTAISGDGNMAIPKGGVVLSAHGAARRLLEGIVRGDPAAVTLDTAPSFRELGVIEAVGGGPRLLEGGQVRVMAREERFRPDIAVGRAPRTAAGITEDGRLLLVTVNGRQPGLSTGMTLEELAGFMLELGARDAVNLDGGGSTTMVIRGRVFNFPSDGAERPVTGALVIVPLGN